MKQLMAGIILFLTTLSNAWPLTYRYFAYGSNMVETTLTALRQVQPLNATAAILPSYKLRFNVGGGGLLDGAAASVDKASSSSASESNVHGVLYELTPEDFAKVGMTEGIPFVYRWQKCKVYPYVGNGDSAGKCALIDGGESIEAFTLVKSFPAADSPPSRSYLNLLIQGAKEWKLDKSFVDELQDTQVARNLLVKDGLAGSLLKFAELRQQKR